MTDQRPSLNIKGEFAELNRRIDELERTIKKALGEQASLNSQLALVGLQNLSPKDFFERITGYPAPDSKGGS
ncbi:hypothetical protein ACIQVO_17870 [Streptomyces sp. NPDC101062]|uniref:hypothetical protein n=1 Tax=unclassified Streptomyces TaxID=2593676 RepID=UPI00382D5115